MKRSIFAAAVAAAALIPFAAQAEDPIRLAFLAASSQNGYNDATWQGRAGRRRRKPAMSKSRYLTASSTPPCSIQAGRGHHRRRRFDGIIIAPNDTVGIATAVEEATKEPASGRLGAVPGWSRSDRHDAAGRRA
jgi:ribose transport system substrate-binding protein